MEAGIAGGIWAGTRTSTDTGADEMTDFLGSPAAVVVVLGEGVSGGGAKSPLESDSSITIMFCEGVALLGSEV